MVVIGSFSWPGIGNTLGFVVSGVWVAVALLSGTLGWGVVWSPGPTGPGPTGTVVSGVWVGTTNGRVVSESVASGSELGISVFQFVIF